MTVLAAELPGIADRRDVAMTEAERFDLIEKTIAEIRPRIMRDGGGIELIAVHGKDVYVKMSGACIGCQLAGVTLGGVQQRLMEALKQVVRVLPAEMLKQQA